jgi:hypothetical protein
LKALPVGPEMSENASGERMHLDTKITGKEPLVWTLNKTITKFGAWDYSVAGLVRPLIKIEGARSLKSVFRHRCNIGKRCAAAQLQRLPNLSKGLCRSQYEKVYTRVMEDHLQTR